MSRAYRWQVSRSLRPMAAPAATRRIRRHTATTRTRVAFCPSSPRSRRSARGGRRSREQKGSVAKLHLHAVARPMLGVIRWYGITADEIYWSLTAAGVGCPTGKSMQGPNRTRCSSR